MNTENFWKIMDTTNGVTVLTYVPMAYQNGDGVYRLMKKLQKVFGSTMNGYQKFDEHHDRLEDFNTILRVHYNIWEERLIDATLFEYDPETESLTVDRQLTRKMVRDWEYTYSWKKTIVKCIDGWNGLRKHLMEWQNFSIGEYKFLGTTPLIELDVVKTRPAITDFISEMAS